MTVASYLPMIIQGIVGGFGFDETDEGHFAAFAVMYFLAIPSALNPFVYLSRVHDFAFKVKELKVTLCGCRQQENQSSPEQIEQGSALGERQEADEVEMETITDLNGFLCVVSASWPDVLNTNEQSTKNTRKSF